MFRIKRADEVSKLSCLMTQEVMYNNLEIQQTLMGIMSTFLELPMENEGQVLVTIFPWSYEIPPEPMLW